MTEITFHCPHCHKSVEAPGDMAGDTADCPSCGGSVVVPSQQQSKAALTPRSRPTTDTKECPFCGEEILAKAKKCKHCQSMLDGSSQGQKMTVAGRDPFAEYHTEIQGKKKGKLTIIGWLGIGLGILFMVVAGMALGHESPGEEEGIFYMFLIGLAFSIASFLWARETD